jgi:hypothetical protein
MKESLHAIVNRLSEHRVETRLAVSPENGEKVCLYHIFEFKLVGGLLRDSSHYEIRSDYEERCFASIDEALTVFFNT